MTTVVGRASGPGPVTGPVDAPRGPRERQLRTLHVVFAVGLMLLGALGSAALVMRASAEGEYLALASDVDYAARLERADLIVVQLGTPSGLRPVPAGDLAEVVGAYAAAPLHAGTLLTSGMLTADPVPGPGQHVVGITVRGDRLPAQRPRPGDAVLLVSTTSEQEGAPATRTWAARVTAVSAPAGGLLQPGRSDFVTLDVLVSVAEGPAVAQAAAANQLVVIRTAGG